MPCPCARRRSAPRAQEAPAPRSCRASPPPPPGAPPPSSRPRHLRHRLCRSSRSPAPFTSGKGREEGTRALVALDQLNLEGHLGFPLLFAKSKTKTANRGAFLPRPRFTSPAANQGSSDVRFPVRLLPDTGRLSQALAGRATCKVGNAEPRTRSRRLRLAQGGHREEIRSKRDEEGRSRPHPAPSRGPASPLPVLPPCTCWASCLWRVPCSPLRCSRVRERRPPPPPPSSPDSASPTQSRTRPRSR